MQKILKISELEEINNLLKKGWRIDFKLDEEHIILSKYNRPRQPRGILARG